MLERRRELRLYTLIDGYLYEQHCGRRIEPSLANRALFVGTEDEPSAQTRWLVFDLRTSHLAHCRRNKNRFLTAE